MYRSKYKLFKGKIRKYIVQMMREAPNKAFSTVSYTHLSMAALPVLLKTENVPYQKYKKTVLVAFIGSVYSLSLIHI